MSGLFVVSCLMLSMKTAWGQGFESSRYEVKFSDSQACKLATTAKCANPSTFQILEDCIKTLPSGCAATVTQTVNGHRIPRNAFSINLNATERRIDSNLKLSKMEFYPIYLDMESHCKNATIHMTTADEAGGFVARIDHNVTGDPKINVVEKHSTDINGGSNNSYIIEYNPPISLPKPDGKENYDYIFVKTSCPASVFNYTATLIETATGTTKPTATGTTKPTPTGTTKPTATVPPVTTKPTPTGTTKPPATVPPVTTKPTPTVEVTSAGKSA